MFFEMEHELDKVYLAVVTDNVIVNEDTQDEYMFYGDFEVNARNCHASLQFCKEIYSISQGKSIDGNKSSFFYLRR